MGAAKALGIDDKVGNFEVGKEADFIAIDPKASTYLGYRMQEAQDIFDLLFTLMTLGDDRNITATYINGKAAYIKGEMESPYPKTKAA